MRLSNNMKFEDKQKTFYLYNIYCCKFVKLHSKTLQLLNTSQQRVLAIILRVDFFIKLDQLDIVGLVFTLILTSKVDQKCLVISIKMIVFRFCLKILTSSRIARLFDWQYRTSRWIILIFGMCMVEEMKEAFGIFPDLLILGREGESFQRKPLSHLLQFVK